MTDMCLTVMFPHLFVRLMQLRELFERKQEMLFGCKTNKKWSLKRNKNRHKTSKLSEDLSCSSCVNQMTENSSWGFRVEEVELHSVICVLVITTVAAAGTKTPLTNCLPSVKALDLRWTVLTVWLELVLSDVTTLCSFDPRKISDLVKGGHPIFASTSSKKKD